MANIKTKQHRLPKYLILILFMTAFLYALINAITIWNYSDKDERTTADVAIVLGAGLSDGKVTPVFQQRINHGIFLYQHGYVKKLIFTGGYGEGNQHSDAWVAKQYAEQQGVPPQDILYEEASTITQGNIRYAKVIMDNQQYQSAIIVSDPLHMKRAMLIAEDAGINAYSSPTPTSMYVSVKNKLAFLARETFFYSLYKIHG